MLSIKLKRKNVSLKRFFLEESVSSFVSARIDDFFIQLDEIDELLR